VRGVARLAAFRLNGLVLKHERTSLIGVARVANRILRRRGSHLLCRYRSVRVVAVAALNQPFVHPMVKGHAELRFLLKMTGVTKLRLSSYQQEFLGLRVMRRMTGDATDIALGVLRINRIHVLGAARMASQATGIDLLSGMVFEDENLCYIAASSNVGRSRTVAPLAPLLGGSSARVV